MSSMGGGSPGPTAQQQALSTLQATTGANLNLEENSQRKIILNVLEENRWNRKRAASELKISYRALLYKIRQAGLPPKRSPRMPAAAPDSARALGDAD